MIANTLIHREFTSSYTAKFVIEKDRMYTENANRSSGDGIITPDNMEPNPKNPIVASFFRNIGWSDRLGSGVRNIFKYSKYYSGETFTVIAHDNNTNNLYIQKALLNGKEYKKCYLDFADIAAGGTLELFMGDKPNTEWGI